MKEILLYSGVYLVLFSLTELFYHKLSFKADSTRKIVHISTGLIAMTFPYYLEEYWQVFLLCLSFLALLGVSEKFKWLPSITSVQRKSHGSWLFALVVLISFYIAYSLDNWDYYYLPLLIMSISDPLAALIGKKTQIIPVNIFGQSKTVGGGIAFWFSACLITYFYLAIKGEASMGLIILVPIISTLAEFFSTKGWDNLTIPMAVILSLKIIESIA